MGKEEKKEEEEEVVEGATSVKVVEVRERNMRPEQGEEKNVLM